MIFKVVLFRYPLFKFALILVLASSVLSCAYYSLSRKNISLFKPDKSNISYVYLLADSWSPGSSNKYNIVINAKNIATINPNEVIPFKLEKGVYEIGVNNGSDFSNIKLGAASE